MKITLTKNQVYLIIEALEWAENPDYPDSDPINAKYIRIENKLHKALGGVEDKPLNANQEKQLQEIADDYSIPIEERIKKLEEKLNKNGE